MLLTPTKVARGALLRFCRIFERREGPGSGFIVYLSVSVAVRIFWVCLMSRHMTHSVAVNVNLDSLIPRLEFNCLKNMDEGDNLVRRRSRRSTAGNR